MSEKEFKVGDWVFLKMGDFQVVGIITEKAELGYVVKANNSYFQYVLDEYMERIDPKTAFLHDLSELLRKYDAEFSDYENYEVIFNLGDKMSIFIDTTDVFNWTNADNLLERATFSDDK